MQLDGVGKEPAVDEIVQGLTSELKNLTIGDQIKELSKHLENTTEELHKQVRDKHDALLQQATHAGRFEAELNALAEHVEDTRSVAHRLKAQFDAQYILLKNQTTVQARLHDLSRLLRAAGVVHSLSHKLRVTKDVLKQAEIHYELSQLTDDADLRAIDFIQPELAYVSAANQKLRSLTQMQLITGLQERNEVQVVHALKVFMNLNTLDTSLDNLMATFIADIEQSLKQCFKGNDITVEQPAGTGTASTKSKSNGSSLRGPGKAPQLTTTQNFRAKFWKSFHWLIYEELYEFCSQILLLDRAMDRITPAATTEGGVKLRFWQSVQNLLKKSFDECPQHVAQTLQEGLSKAIASVRGVEARLKSEFRFDGELFAALRAGYLNKCSANMKACLAGVDLPCNETVDNVVRIASAELSAALIDASLAEAFAEIFATCGQEFCTKLQAQIKLGADAAQIVDVPNIQQQQNVVVANVLCYFKDSVGHMLQDLGRQLENTSCAAQAIIEASLNQVDILIRTILQQILDSMSSAANVIILSMHREPGLNSDKASAVTGPSMYMKELQEFMQRSWTNHVSPFDDKPLTTKCGHELAKRCIELFMHNACIIRPLSQAGRQRLQFDCGYMEQALKAIASNFSELGRPARMLRAFALLIVQEPAALAQQSVGHDMLVPSYMVLLLLFAHASPELQSPHVTAGWSNERLVEWLDGHTSERERLELISGALQRYRDDIRRKNSQQYDGVYPMLFEAFERALSALN